MDPSLEQIPLSTTMVAKVCANIQQKDNTDAESTYSQQLVPFNIELKDLTVGHLITVSGTVQKKCKRFSMNFLCSKDPSPDIAFHFNPRLEQRYVVRNCRINGYWGQEETSSIMPFDFYREQRFRVSFFISEREFMVTVNGKHWCSFTYRLPISSIIEFDVHGQVDIDGFNTERIDSYPQELPELSKVTVDDTTRQKFKMPYLGQLERKFETGWEIEVSGRPKLLPQNFFINLQEGPQLWPHPNIPLHLNPRFSTLSGVDVFVRNAWYDGSWSQEERAPRCPFMPGIDFVIQIRCDFDAFTVWSADGMLAEFRFRCPTHKIQYVHIAGDVEVYNVSLHERERVVPIIPKQESKQNIKSGKK